MFYYTASYCSWQRFATIVSTLMN